MSLGGTVKLLYPYVSRISMFSLIGVIGLVVGLALQWALVEFAGVSFIGAFTIQLVITIWLNYELNRRYTWRSRHQNRWQAVQFFTSRVATGAVAWVLNVILLLIPGMPYMVASFIATGIVMAINFVVGEVVIFKRPLEPLQGIETTPSMQLSGNR